MLWFCRRPSPSPRRYQRVEISNDLFALPQRIPACLIATITSTTPPLPEGKTSVLAVACAVVGQGSPFAVSRRWATSLGSVGRGSSRLVALVPRRGPVAAAAGRAADAALCWGGRDGPARGARSR